MKNMKLRLTCFALIVGSFASETTADTLRTVAFLGDAAPGTGNDFAGFLNVVLNDAGQTAFLAGTGDQVGIWSEGGGSLHAVALGGSTAPGTDGFFDNFYNLNFAIPNLGNGGHTVFTTGLVGSGLLNLDGVWVEREGSLALVAGLGDPTPGVDGFFNFFSPFRGSTPAINSAGQTAFSANEKIWSEAMGSLAEFPSAGSVAPGTSEIFSALQFSNVNINDSGQTAFAGCFGDCQPTFWLNFRANSTGVWSGTSDSLTAIALQWDSAPDTDSVFLDFSTPAINNAGQTAFVADILSPGGGLGSTRNTSIWSEGNGSLALVAREGNPAPGTDATFAKFVGSSKLLHTFNSPQPSFPALNSAGQTAFLALITGPTVSHSNSLGIWSEGSGSLDLVARQESEAPGTDALFSGFGDLILSGTGQTAFHATLTGPGVDASNIEGIWAQDSSGQLKLIVREGDLLDVDDGPGTDFRTIRHLGKFIGGTGNEDGRPSSFNELGQLAFSVTFTDGSNGVFVSNLVAVPEPSSLVLLAVAGLIVNLNRCR